MSAGLSHVRSEVQRAAEIADRTEREQLRSIDEGLMEFSESEKTTDGPIRTDRLAELREKLEGLSAETAGEAHHHVENAVDALTWELGEREREPDSL